MMLQVSLDLIAEMEAFAGLLETLSEKDWETPTLFMDWTPWDVVAHLHYFDKVSIRALDGHESFAPFAKDLVKRMGQGESAAVQTRVELDGVSPSDLLSRWKATCIDMAKQLGESDPKRRLPWFGPDMGVQMFTTARFMETWAHAQAVYDLKNASRTHSDRIKNIVAIGVRTFGWTFVNRKLEAPGPPPYVRLTAPSGAVWEYGEPSETERVEGEAVDFCMAVTQVRNWKDTGLAVSGEVALAWMNIAQCFAGPPVDPPAPGYRKAAQ
ncbi:MAG: TIGR03084 family metal-binding protein [Myxococcota bacterium]